MEQQVKPRKTKKIHYVLAALAGLLAYFVIAMIWPQTSQWSNDLVKVVLDFLTGR
ncbi:hypothetical protein [Schleiferilactobacillus harbinensis]|jgi:hypothetical protein|uniref:hypothetical protein n=1 Tax=Schleiferilactobacillus harbinensis TaxID=304207 RepID=UPI0011740428|nr:hypothetical protein [Schleiferilactobacillus harbinensis]GEK05761.1 hypothetical protein LHA01_10000 [Schleiferilactobacillus harbinensis]